jgi:predicted Ser/Thr protein kinase
LRQGATAETATQTGAIPFQPPDVAEVARLFPQLEILSFIGKGGMGAVYKARQPALDRLVALKLLPPQVAGGPGFAERFSREARALAKLNHPNIVAVYEFGQVNGLPFFLMEFVDGLNLRELERAGKLSPREALQIVPQICEALQFAHDEGVVHRDIKPENILLDKKGRVKIADFGIAKIMGVGSPGADAGLQPGGGDAASAAPGAGQARLTEDGKIIGTPNYMAPEQVEAPQSVDHRADIFSLGVVFYEMLTGELPLGKFAPPSSRTCGVTVDVRLDEVVLRALEREPERRYQQASQVKTAVQNITGFPGQPPSTFPQQGFEYRSRTTLFGLPLLHVATGVDPATGQPRVARGIIAVGGIAQGVVAIGGVAMGGLTCGGMSLGVIAIGGCAIGLVSFGGLAVALLAAFGGGAIAPFAIGGGAVGYLAYGGAALGIHPLGANASDEVARHFFGTWARQAMSSVNVVSLVVLALILPIFLGVPFWLRRKMLADSANSSTQPFSGPSPAANQNEPAPSALAFAAMIFAGSAGILGVVTICMLPQPPEILAWSILASALLGIALGIASRTTRYGRWAIVTGTINVAIWLIIAAVYIFRGSNQPSGDHTTVVPAERSFGSVIEAIVEPSSGQTGYDLDTGRTMELGSPGGPGGDLVVRQTEAGVLSFFFVGTRAEHFQDGDARWNAAPWIIATNLAIIPKSPDAFTNADGLSWHPAQLPVRSAKQLEGDFPETYEFQTREGNMGVLQILGTNGNPRGIKIRYKLVENANASPPTTQAISLHGNMTFNVAATGVPSPSYQWRSGDTNDSVETWSPAIAAGEKPDYQKILNDAKDLTDHGQYEEALQRLNWYFNHSKFEPGQGAVRLSFALSSWMELGRRYPKARQALIEIRDHDTREIIEGRGYSELVQEVQAINHELQDDDSTYALFKTIRAKDPQLAGQVYLFLEDLPVSKGEYQWCYDHIGDPQTRFDQIHQNLDMLRDNQKRMSDFQQKMAQQRADWNQQHGVTNTRSFALPDNTAMLKKFANDGFVGKTRELIEILVATGHMSDAENIRDQAVKILDDPRLPSAIADAQKAIQSKHAENTN